MHTVSTARDARQLLRSALTIIIVASPACIPFEGDGSSTSGSSSGEGGTTGSASTSSTGSTGVGGAGPVTEQVTVIHSDGTPDVGARVLVNAANGTIAFEAATDTSGVAVVNTPVGGSISVAEIGTRTVQTILEPPKGSKPRFVLPIPNTHTPLSFNFSLTGTPASAKSFRIFLSCGTQASGNLTNQAGQATIPAYVGCAESNQFDVLAIVYDVGGNSLANAFVPGVNIQASLTTTLPTWTTNQQAVANASVPSFDQGTNFVEFRVFGRHLGRQDFNISYNPGTVSSPFSSVLPIPYVLDDYGLSVTTGEVPSGGADRQRQYLLMSATLPATATWTPSTLALPGALNASAGPPATLSYSLDAGALGDAIVFNGSQPDPGGAYHYSMRAPATMGATLRWPDLPADLGQLYFGKRLTQLWVSNDDVVSASTYGDYIALGRTIEAYENDSFGAVAYSVESAYNASAFSPVNP